LSTFALVALLACGNGSSPDGAAPDPNGSPDGAGEAKREPAPDPTGWIAVGDLHEPRALATATLLDDGRVLVVGGEDTRYGMLASVEIFDAATGTFEKGAPLPEPRDHHTATRLPNGQVLVAGGGLGSQITLPRGEGTLASAVLFDPKTGTWTRTADMHVARAGHRAVLLPDGRVLVAGGGGRVGYDCHSSHPNCTVAESLGSAEIYDPATGAWTETGPLGEARLAFSLDVTPLGIVAAFGAAKNKGLETVEIFDPKTNAWTFGPKLAGEQFYHASAVLGGELVVAGGKIANVKPITTVNVLDASGASWRPRASLGDPRTGASLVPLESGKGLLVAGSNQLGERFLAEAALYDPTADTWTKIAPLAKGRFSHATVRLRDGSVLVIGGRSARGALATAERTSY
jgi:N-acetylneuraminic acid mutarotase